MEAIGQEGGLRVADAEDGGGPLGDVLWHVAMSLDGFIADTDDGVGWAFGHGRPGPLADRVVQATGAIVAGRRLYEIATQRQGGAIYGGAWSGRVFVLTHAPPKTGAIDGVTFHEGAVGAVVDLAREAAGGRSVGIFGASVARQCLAAGLVDEIVVHVVPVLLGQGLRLYDGADVVALERVAVAGSDQIADLRYRVLRRP